MKILRISPIIAVVFLWVQIWGSFNSALAQTVEEDMLAVAVADLDVSGTSVEESGLLTDRLRAEIWKTQKFNILERQKMDDILKEQGFQLSGACDQASCLIEIGKLLPVEKIIGGSIGKIGTTWTITLRLIDIESGRIEKTVVQDCPQCSIDEILSPYLSYAAMEMGDVDFEYAQADAREGGLSDASRDSYVRMDKDKSKQDMGQLSGQEAKKDGGSILGKWWFWVLIAGVGGGAAFALGGAKSDDPGGGGSGGGNGSVIINWR